MALRINDAESFNLDIPRANHPAINDRDQFQFQSPYLNQMFGLDNEDHQSEFQELHPDILDEIEDLLRPSLQFQSNPNNFISNNRANNLRTQTIENRIQSNNQLQQRQNNQQQQQQDHNPNIRPTNIMNRRNNNRDNIVQVTNVQRRRERDITLSLMDYDELLNEIDRMQVETDTLVSNLESMDRLVNRQQEEVKHEEELKELSDKGYKQQIKRKYMKVGNNQDTCSICLKNLAKGDSIYELICQHLFHVDCIAPWFKQSHCCPNCRKDLNTAIVALPSIDKKY